MPAHCEGEAAGGHLMGLLSWITRQFRRRPTPKVNGGRPRLRGRYDAAATTSENENHWAQADHLSARGANTPGVRATLRSRARYETSNNGDAKGLVRTIRNDTVGVGPRLQVSLPESWTDPDFGITQTTPAGAAHRIERLWQQWCDLVGLSDDLRVMEETGERDGECFLIQVTNGGLPADGVQLDVRLLEADQVTTPNLIWNDPLRIDGIQFDQWGNPVGYDVLKQHPGDPTWVNPWTYDTIPAAAVIHWFDPDRPQQARGIPSITPSLPLWAILRRYTLAALGSAETAASIAGVLKTETPADGDTATPKFETMDEVEMPRRGLLTLPAGWDASAFESKQPVVGHREFRGEVLTEAGRPVCAPRNVSTGSSAEYNYSSARLDHLPYRTNIRINRDRMRRLVLDRLFRTWIREATLIPNFLPAGLPPVSLWAWTWHWDAFESIDPQKDAAADDMALKNGTKTLGQILAEQGKDWEEHLRQRAREIALARRLERENGLTPGTLYPLTTGEQAATPTPETPANADAETAA